MRYLLLFFQFFLVAFLLTGEQKAMAEAVSAVENDHTRVELIAGEKEGETYRLGLKIALNDDWKTYWRSPGDAGSPVHLDWSASENVKDVVLNWPAPTRYQEGWGLETFGYAEAVVFPLEVTTTQPDAPATLVLNVDYTICSDICIPYQVTLTKDLSPEMAAPEKEAEMLSEWQARVPVSEPEDIQLEAVALYTDRLEVMVQAEQPLSEASDLFVEGPSGFRFPKPAVVVQDEGHTQKFIYQYETVFKDKTLAGEPLRLTLVSGDKVATFSTMPELAELPRTEHEVSPPALGLMLLFALIGGLILNVMPCVLPVLSIKVIGVLEHSQGTAMQVRKDFLATALGIVFSFLVLAMITLMLKSAGMAVGWGFHFQEPNFLIALALIITLFAASMWGWFDIRTPGWLTGAMEGTGGRSDRSLIAHFMTGAFATLLATPCTAPFLGTAIGFALSGGAEQTLLMFGVMGVGLAIPYLLVAVYPKAVHWLPKPGAWMVTVKVVLGFFLLATVGWLVWVLESQVGDFGALIVLGLCGLMLAKLWLAKRHAALSRKHILLPVLFVLAALAFILPSNFQDTEIEQQVESDTLWQPFDQKAIAVHVSAGRVVLVDVTADWCLTCKFNKLNVLDSEEIRTLLRDENVVAMRADWTNRNPAIGKYLASFGRYGIPFNVVYGPENPDGEPLSELLSKTEVKSAILASQAQD